MVPLTLNALTILVKVDHLKEWVYSERDGYIWDLSQLLTVQALYNLTVKWLMGDPLILITPLSSFNLEKHEI